MEADNASTRARSAAQRSLTMSGSRQLSLHADRRSTADE